MSLILVMDYFNKNLAIVVYVLVQRIKLRCVDCRMHGRLIEYIPLHLNYIFPLHIPILMICIAELSYRARCVMPPA